jgi:hypothetical protein
MTNGLPQAPAGAILAGGITAPPCRRLTSMPADPTTSRSAIPVPGLAEIRHPQAETRTVGRNRKFLDMDSRVYLSMATKIHIWAEIPRLGFFSTASISRCGQAGRTNRDSAGLA